MRSAFEAASRIRALDRQSPGALQLAELASPAVLVEPELLRALRLELLPGRDVSCEADLWSSALVQATSPSGLTFFPEVHVELRARLMRTHDGLRNRLPPGTKTIAERAWDVIEKVHRDTSPAIRLEEAVAWLDIAGDAAGIEAELTRALKTMVEDPDRGLAAWWARARERLPESVWEFDVASALDRTSMAQLAGVSESSDDDPTAGSERLVRDAPIGAVRVRRTARAVEIGALDPQPGTFSIEVPRLNPIRLQLGWQAGNRSVSSVVSLSGGETVLVPADPGAVRIKTERGDLFELPEPSDEPEVSEVLPLADLMQGVAGAMWRSGAGAIAEPIEEYADPPWQRGLRALHGRLDGLPEDPTFSSFVLHALELLEREATPATPRLESTLRSSQGDFTAGLRELDHRDTAKDVTSEVGAFVASGALEFAEEMRKAVSTRDPLAQLGQWILAQAWPLWERASAEITEKEVRSQRSDELVDRLRERSLGEYARRVLDGVMPSQGTGHTLRTTAVRRASVDYLRRHRPDLDLIGRLGRNGVHLEGGWSDFATLAGWGQKRLPAALGRLIEERSKALSARRAAAEQQHEAAEATGGSAEETATETTLRVLVFTEKDVGDLTRRVLQRLEELSLEHEVLLHEPSKGVPELRTLSDGNSLHHLPEDEAAVRDLQQRLVDLVGLRGVMHPESVERFPGVEAQPRAGTVALYLVEPVAEWAVVSVGGLAASPPSATSARVQAWAGERARERGREGFLTALAPPEPARRLANDLEAAREWTQSVRDASPDVRAYLLLHVECALARQANEMRLLLWGDASDGVGTSEGQPRRRVFLTSTTKDLKEHRDAVRRAIRSLGHDAVALEDFGAEPRAPVQESVRRVRESDAVVLLLGERYGWVPSAEEGGDGHKSIAWLEAEAAVNAGVPLFAFLSDLSSATAEGGPVDGRFDEFRSFLKERPVVGMFSSPEDLTVQVTGTLGRWTAERAEATSAIPSLTLSELDREVGRLKGFDAALVVVDGSWREEPDVPVHALLPQVSEPDRPVAFVRIVNTERAEHGRLTDVVFEGLSGAAVDGPRRVSANALAAYVQKTMGSAVEIVRRDDPTFPTAGDAPPPA